MRIFGRTFRRPLEELSLATALGLGILGSLIFALGLDRLWFDPTLLAIMSFLAIVGAGIVWRRLPVRIGGGSPGRLAAGAMLLICLWSVCLALLPETNVDALMYHLAAPAQFLRTHGWVYERASHAFKLPLQAEMLFVWPLALANETVPKLLVLVMLVDVVVVGAMLAGLNSGAPLVWLGMLLFAGSRQVMALLAGPNNDLLAVLFVVSGILAVERRRRPLAWVFLGLAVATKLTGVFFAPLILVWPGLRGKGGWPRCWGSLRWSWMAVLPMLPWLLKNGLYLGNPFVPFLSDVIPTLDWDRSSLRVWKETQVESFAAAHTDTMVGALWHLPVRLFTTSPGLVVALLFVWTRGKLADLRLLAVLVAYEWAFIFLARSDRYGLATDLLLAVLVAERLVAFVSSANRRWAVSVAAGAGVLVLLQLAAQCPDVAAHHPARFLAGAQTREDYLDEHLGGLLRAQRFVNREAGGGRLLLAGEFRLYRFAPTVYSALSFGMPPLIWTLTKASGTPGRLRVRFRQLGLGMLADNFVTAQYQVDVNRPFAWDRRMLVLYRDFMRAYARVILKPETVDHRNGGFYVYRVEREPGHAAGVVPFLPGAEGMYNGAREAERRGEAFAARTELAALVRMLPDVAAVRNHLADADHAAHRWEAAYQEYVPGIRAGVVDDENWSAFAEAAFMTNRYGESQAAFVRAEGLYPERRDLIRGYLASLAFITGDRWRTGRHFQEAINSYRKCSDYLNALPATAEVAERQAVCYLSQSDLLIKIGDHVGARAAMAKAQAVYPPIEKTKNYLNVIQALEGRTRE